MLSLFPELLFLAPFSAFLIRISLSILLVYEGWRHISKPDMRSRIGGMCEIGVAIVLAAGIWTQLFALGLAFALVLSFFIRPYRTYPISTMLLAVVMALSLAVTGAGPFSFDLPL